MNKKRKFRKLGGFKYRLWKNWEIGDYLLGKFVCTSVDKKYKKDNYHILVEENNFDDSLNGQEICLNGAGSVAYKMEGVEEGTGVRFEYLGEGTVEKGDFAGDTFHDIDVSTYEDDFDVEAIKNAQDNAGGGSRL